MPTSAFNQHIVGIGASAGGLEAILELFDSIPHDIPCSFIIIQHLSPDYKSMMPELLEKHTKMHIQEAEEGMLVKPNCVYVIPHKKTLTFQYGKLKLTDKEHTKAPNTAIDIFLTSLAEDKKEKAIGIILSGTGSDGTKGLQAIKQNGGLTIVQDPLTAKFDGMPNSAINSGYSDFVLAPELMQEEILHHISGEPSTLYPTPITEEDEEVIMVILNHVKFKTGQDFTLYKRPTISRRIAKRMSLHNINTIREYKELIIRNEDEVQQLSKEFLIGVTRFFRDEVAYEKIQNDIFPQLFKNKTSEDKIKFWVAGCSTGEEAFSMAILTYEYLQKKKLDIEVKIFATDIDKEAIEFASKSCYGENILKDVSKERLENYFEEVGDRYKVLPHIRKMVVFAQHDLVKNAPYSKMDLISCRNVLIYLSPLLQKSIFAKFHFSLNQKGFLFLGPSENLGEYESAFTELDKKWRIYANSGSLKPAQKEFNTLGNVNAFLLTETTRDKSEKLHASSSGSLQSLNDILLKECDYAALYISDSFELVQASGNYNRYLHLPKQNLDLNVLKMVPDELAAILGSAVRKAVKTNNKVSYNGIRIKEGKKNTSIDVSVVGVPDKKFLKKFFWVLLKESSTPKTKRDSVTFKQEDFDSHERLAELEHELSDTKERLQTAIEELETSNEEMQSSNEELVSANEELQSTNEELQSLNEELHTVNAEHQLKIKELIDLNDDLNNYFRSSDIGQVFIDRNLLIRKYTPAVVEQINLIGSDVGRPISHISNNIYYEGLIQDLQKVLSQNSIVQKEIQSKNQKWFLVKILPYIKVDKSTDGAIISFVDITSLKNLNHLFSGVLNSSLNAIMAFKSIRDKKDEIIDFTCILMNEAGEKVTKYKIKDIVGKTLLNTPESKQGNLFEKYKKVVETGEPLHIEHYHEGVKSWLEIAAVKMDDGFAVTFDDITQKKNSEQKIKQAYDELTTAQTHLRQLNNELEGRVQERTKELSISEERFKTLSLATNDAIWDWDFATNTVWWNEGFKKMFGYASDEIEPGVESWFSRIHLEDKDRVIKGIQEVITKGKKQWTGEYRLQKADGSYASILDRAYVLHYEDQMPYRMIGSMVDLTHLKKVQTELENTNRTLIKINTDLDNFVYTASHDLKAPISNIEGLMDVLQDLTSEESEDIHAILDMVRSSVHKFKETINALTDVAKIQKEYEEEPELLRIKEMTDEVQSSIQHMFTSSNAKILFDLEEPQVKFSKKNFRSILYNLLSNSIKYRAEDQSPVIKISSKRIDDYVKLTLEDNGLGIDPSRIKHIFGMFKRFHTHVEGTGIGLYMVKRMVENASGKIEVESQPGKGTKFHLYLQLEAKHKEQPEQQKA